MKNEVVNDQIDFHKNAILDMVGSDFLDSFIAIIKARTPLIYIIANEERRVLKFFKHLSVCYGYKGAYWDCYNGIKDVKSDNQLISTSDIKDENAILDHIIQESRIDKDNIENLKSKNINGSFYILFDYNKFISPEMSLPSTERRLKTLVNEESISSVIIVSSSYRIVESLRNSFSIVDFPYPSKSEIKENIEALAKATITKIPSIKKDAEDKEEQIIKACSGIPLNDVKISLSKSIVTHKEFNIKSILKEKEQLIKKQGNGALTYFNTDLNYSNIGGMNNLIKYLKDKKIEFSNKAREYGISPPKGILIIGEPGNGKSLICKCIANEFGMPLLSLDIGALYGSLVGETESNLRSIISIAEIVNPCVLWLDEVEKTISQSSTESDGGTSSRVLKTLLTWMQERTKPIYIVATANNYKLIPPEFMRAGRFDETWYVGLPNLQERIQILKAILLKFNKNFDNLDFALVSKITDGYSGAELDKIINYAMSDAFRDNCREVLTSDLVKAAHSFKPLSIMRKEDVSGMKEWARNNCRFASPIDDDSYQSINNDIKVDI